MQSSLNIPQLPNSGLLGVMPRFLADPLNFFEEARPYDAPFVKFRIAHKQFFYVNDHDVLLTMLKNWKVFQKGSGKMAKMTLGTGLVFAEEEDWTQQRRIIAPAFHHKALLSYQDIMQRHAQRKVDEWAREQAMYGKADLTKGFFEVAIRVLRDSLFGTKSDEQELQVVLEGVDVLLKHVIDREKNPFLPALWIPTARNQQTKAYIRKIREVVLGNIREREDADDGQITLIDMMIHGRDKKTGEGLSDENVIDQVKLFFIAGTETSSNTMSFIAYELANHPEIFQALQREIDEVLQGRMLEMKELGKLPLLHNVIQEVLRMYPATWLNTRTNVTDIEIGGYHFKAGSKFMFSAFEMQRSTKGWAEPEKFIPSRWDEADAKAGYFMPFLAGPRKCIGDQFALAEISIVLATMMQRFAWRMPDGYQLELTPNATLQLKPNFKVVLEER